MQSVLDLSQNSVTGNIPSTLGTLTRLENLNLSHNNLGGSIPPSFENMASLTIANLSYNNLEGPVPDIKVFQSAQLECLSNNKHLCGVVKGLPPCGTGASRKGRFS